MIEIRIGGKGPVLQKVERSTPLGGSRAGESLIVIAVTEIEGRPCFASRLRSE